MLVILQFLRTTRTYDGELKEFDFISQQDKLVIPLPLTGPRGINKEKEEKIINNLCPLMPSKNTVFWKELIVDQKAADLLETDDLVDYDDELAEQ